MNMTLRGRRVTHPHLPVTMTIHHQNTLHFPLLQKLLTSLWLIMHMLSRHCRQMLPHSEASSTLLKKMSEHFSVTSLLSWTSSRSSLTTFINICTHMHHLQEALMLDSFCFCAAPVRTLFVLILGGGVHYYSQNSL